MLCGSPFLNKFLLITTLSSTFNLKSSNTMFTKSPIVFPLPDPITKSVLKSPWLINLIP